MLIGSSGLGFALWTGSRDPFFASLIAIFVTFCVAAEHRKKIAVFCRVRAGGDCGDRLTAHSAPNIWDIGRSQAQELLVSWIWRSLNAWPSRERWSAITERDSQAWQSCAGQKTGR